MKRRTSRAEGTASQAEGILWGRNGGAKQEKAGERRRGRKGKGRGVVAFRSCDRDDSSACFCDAEPWGREDFIYWERGRYFVGAGLLADC